VVLNAHVAIIVTRGDPTTLRALFDRCQAAQAEGQTLRVFFRDEAIPTLCQVSVAERLGWPDNVGGDAELSGWYRAALTELTAAGAAQLYACTSSLYIWGLTAAELMPCVTGGRGLIAFLADDLVEAAAVYCF
jgi:peroxiredoxin family protein